MSMQFFHGVGRRKSSVARVHLAPVSGKQKKGSLEINHRSISDYFSDEGRSSDAMLPLSVLQIDANDYHIKINVNGGGAKGQADAIALGLARALNALEMHQLGLSKEQAHAMQEEAALALRNHQDSADEQSVIDEREPAMISKRTWYVLLKKNKLLRVDSRRSERKKVGLRGARKRPQFSKR